MLVIIEGADGSGKTTLANRLRKSDIGHHWLIRSNGPANSVIDMTKAAEWITRGVPPRTNIICDRFPLLSEWVYGPILRGKCMHDYSPSLLARYFLTAPYPIRLIYCRPKNPRLSGQSHRKGVSENIGRIVTAYDNLMKQLGMEGVAVHLYDFEDDDGTAEYYVKIFFAGESHG